MSRSVVNKRTLTVCSKISERDWQDFEAAAKKLWPGMHVSRSSTMLYFAKRGLEVAMVELTKQRK